MEETSTTTTATSVVTLETLGPINSEESSGERITEENDNTLIHICSLCSYQTENKTLFLKHVKIHNTDKPFKCSHCEREFRDSVQLTNHVNIHLGLKPYQCAECNLTFTTRGELVRHTRYKHTLEKPHKCDYENCDYASVELSKLKRHMRIHSGERPYLCPHCDYAARDTFKLKRHIRIHTGEKPYECPVCNHRFTQSNSLKSHLIVHGDSDIVFKCKYCEIKYNDQKSLTNHIKKEHKDQTIAVSQVEIERTDDLFNLSDGKPAKELEILQKQQQKLENSITSWFSCSECSMKFSNKETLENHKIKHTGDRPYLCSICGISFGQQFALRAHIKSHNKKKEDDVEVMSTVESEETEEDEECDEKENKEVEIVMNDLIDKAIEISNKEVPPPPVESIEEKKDEESTEPPPANPDDYSKTIEEVLQNIALTPENHVSLAVPKKPLSKTALKEKEKAEQRLNNKSGSVVYCDICSKLFLNTSTLIRHMKDKHSIISENSGKTKNYDFLVSHLNETAKSQNYKGISIPVLTADKVNTNGSVNESVNGSTEKDVSSSNLESVLDSELLFRRNDTYSSLTEGITVLQKNPRKKNPPKARESTKLAKANPIKTAKCSAHLALKEGEVEIPKVKTPRKRPSRAKKVVVAPPQPEEKKEEEVKPKRGGNRKKVDNNVKPAEKKEEPEKTKDKKTEEPEKVEENKTPTSNGGRKRKASKIENSEKKSDSEVPTPVREKREASKRAKLFISYYESETIDD